MTKKLKFIFIFTTQWTPKRADISRSKKKSMSPLLLFFVILLSGDQVNKLRIIYKITIGLHLFSTQSSSSHYYYWRVVYTTFKCPFVSASWWIKREKVLGKANQFAFAMFIDYFLHNQDFTLIHIQSNKKHVSGHYLPK